MAWQRAARRGDEGQFASGGKTQVDQGAAGVLSRNVKGLNRAILRPHHSRRTSRSDGDEQAAQKTGRPRLCERFQARQALWLERKVLGAALPRWRDSSAIRPLFRADQDAAISLFLGPDGQKLAHAVDQGAVTLQRQDDGDPQTRKARIGDDQRLTDITFDLARHRG